MEDIECLIDERLLKPNQRKKRDIYIYNIIHMLIQIYRLAIAYNQCSESLLKVCNSTHINSCDISYICYISNHYAIMYIYLLCINYAETAVLGTTICHYSCHSVPRLAAMKAYMSAVSSICRKTGKEEEEEV